MTNGEEVNNQQSNKKKANYRQWILIAVLVFVGAAFLYDKYVLLPSATEKINEITNNITASLSADNKQQVHDLIGMKPSEVVDYKGLEIERYKFPRGLPFYPKPILDIAYKDGAISFFSREHMTEEYIDSKNLVTISEEERSRNVTMRPVGLGQ